MGTQGVLSIVKNGVVKYKIIVGCDGQWIEELKDKIKGLPFADMSCAELYQNAEDACFGCTDCRVVMDDTGEFMGPESFVDMEWPPEALESYTSTFSTSIHNPRWKRGTAEYVAVIVRP